MSDPSVPVVDNVTDLPSSSSSSSLSENEAKNRFLSSIAASAVTQAAALYEKSSTLIKTHGPQIVKVNLEKVEATASDLSNKYQIKDKVVGVSTPWIEWADTHVDAAYQKVVQRRNSLGLFLQSPLAQRVNETLVTPFRVYLLTQYTTLADDFRSKSEEAFSAIHQSVQVGKEKASDIKQHADSFIADMKTRLGQQWNDRLKEPALSYYTVISAEYETLLKKADATKIQLQQLFASTKEKLGENWNASVAAAYRRYELTYQQAFEAYTSKVKEPAAAFYLRGFQAYSSLQATSAKGVVTFEEFVAGLRLDLATLWNDRLLEPAKALYENFSSQKVVDAKPAASS